MLESFFILGKKRDLSDDSRGQGEGDSKKAKESSASSCNFDYRAVFSEELDDSSCRDILYNYLKHLQTEVNDFANLAKD